MITRESLRNIEIKGIKFKEVEYKYYMRNRRLIRNFIKRELKAYCRFHKVSMRSLRNSCYGKPTLNKMFEVIGGDV